MAAPLSQDGSDEMKQNKQMSGCTLESYDGHKWWYIDGKCYTEQEFKEKINNCEGKVVEIDGKKYKLTAV